MRSAYVITVQHTGTGSMIELFRQAGYIRYKPKHAHHRTWEPEGFSYIGHVFQESATDLREGVPVITTMRNPGMVIHSWMHRYGYLSQNHHQLQTQLRQWQEDILPHADFIVPIDIPQLRDERLAEIADFLGTKFDPFPWKHKGERKRQFEPVFVEWPEIKHPVYEVYDAAA